MAKTKSQAGDNTLYGFFGSQVKNISWAKSYGTLFSLKCHASST